MKALGMIEVYGYLTAVEALDSALKAANVSLLDVVCVKGGLVTVLVTGDVGATKAAMDASVAAAERVGRVVSVHVIPRPAGDVARMLGEGPSAPPAAPPPEPAQAVPEATQIAPEPAQNAPEATQIAPEPTQNAPEATQIAPEPTQNAPEAAQDLDEEDESLDSLPQEPVDPATLTPDILFGMKVLELRALARHLGVTSMTRREIRFAKKEELVAEILKFCGQEG